eukprot:TRINITY_DN17365_c0_g1_i1.p1 TRINITY_DN17365_c0_g1~~TRINITY_DN17365_c0_g1_i1.p1  ORF type:complete len:105 (-),score=8.92 TRINITY_DN17365_c0_g1_i1:50-364(-)
MAQLLVKRLSEFGRAPVRGSNQSAGYDLFAAHPVVIPRRGSGLVHTDIALQIPQGYYGRVAPRSSLALKFGIDVGAGVIDPDYRGEVGVLLFNHSDTDFQGHFL